MTPEGPSSPAFESLSDGGDPWHSLPAFVIVPFAISPSFNTHSQIFQNNLPMLSTLLSPGEVAGHQNLYLLEFQYS